jgi:hypothetical protein
MLHRLPQTDCLQINSTFTKLSTKCVGKNEDIGIKGRQKDMKQQQGEGSTYNLSKQSQQQKSDDGHRCSIVITLACLPLLLL